MEIPGLQIVFILIVLAEWIFMGSTQVFRGYMAERWEMPVGLKSAGYAAAFGILFAYYIGERLIYRKKPDGSQPIVLRPPGNPLGFIILCPISALRLCRKCDFSVLGEWAQRGSGVFSRKTAGLYWTVRETL